jgi:hypothetical protein
MKRELTGSPLSNNETGNETALKLGTAACFSSGMFKMIYYKSTALLNLRFKYIINFLIECQRDFTLLFISNVFNYE